MLYLTYGIGELITIITLYLYINQTITKLQRQLVSHEKSKGNDCNMNEKIGIDSLRIIKPFYRVTSMGVGLMTILWSIGLIFQLTILFFVWCIYQGIVGSIVCLYFTIILVKLKRRLSKKENEYYVYRSNKLNITSISPTVNIEIEKDVQEDINTNANSNEYSKNKLDKCIICISLFIVTLLTTLWTFRMVEMIQRIFLGIRSVDSLTANIIFIYQIIYGLTNNISLFTIVHSNSNLNSMTSTGNNGCCNWNINNNNNNNNNNYNNTIGNRIQSVSVTSKSDDRSTSGTSIMKTRAMKNKSKWNIECSAMQDRRCSGAIDTIDISNIVSTSRDIQRDIQRAATVPVSYISQKNFQKKINYNNTNVNILLNQSWSLLPTQNSNAGFNTDCSNNNNNNNFNQSNDGQGTSEVYLLSEMFVFVCV